MAVRLLAPDDQPAGNVLLLATAFGVANKATYFSKKIKAWDPSKHPKGHKGLFIETPDKKKATHAAPGDVIVTKSGKAFKVDKQTEKGVKVNPVDQDSGEIKSGYTVLGNDIDIAVVEGGKGAGTTHAISDLEPDTYIKTKAGKRFKISKHGKWTTVYPVDDKGQVNGKHTVLPPTTVVTVDAQDVSGTVDNGFGTSKSMEEIKKLMDQASKSAQQKDGEAHQQLQAALESWLWDTGWGNVLLDDMAMVDFGDTHGTVTKPWSEKIAKTVGEHVADETPAGWIDALGGVLEQQYGMPTPNVDMIQEAINHMESHVDMVQKGDQPYSSPEPPAAPKIDAIYIATSALKDDFQIHHAKNSPSALNIYNTMLGQLDKGITELDDLYKTPFWQWLENMHSDGLISDPSAVVSAAIAKEHAKVAPKQTIEEILPTKLPKVPKGYPAGAGKDTSVIIRVIGSNFEVQRIDGNGNVVGYLGMASTKTAAKKLARDASADYEQIDWIEDAIDHQKVWQAAEDAEVDDWMVTQGGDIVRIVGFVDKETSKYVYDGPTASYKTVKVMQRHAQYEFVNNYEGDKKVHTAPAQWHAVKLSDKDLTEVIGPIDNDKYPNNTDLPLNIGKGRARQVWRDHGLITAAQGATPEIVRKARPERYTPELHYDWTPDTLVGKSTNEALKALSGIGYREIKPRQKDRLRVIDANGRRLVLHRDGNNITSVEMVQSGAAIAIEGTAREQYQQLMEALDSGADISALDPRLRGAEATSHVRTMIYDLAVGHRNGVAAALGKEIDPDLKVKTDAEYLAELEQEGEIGSIEDYMAEADRDPYVVQQPRAGSLKAFGIEADAGITSGDNWVVNVDTTTFDITFKTDLTMTREEAVALSAIMKRQGIANLLGQPDPAPDEVGTGADKSAAYVESMKASDPITAAVKLAQAANDWKALQAGPLADLDEDSRNYVLTNLEKFEAVGGPIFDSIQESHRTRADNLRKAALGDEIQKRRAAEGTVPVAPGTSGEFDLPVWNEIAFESQSFADINLLVGDISGKPRPSRDEVKAYFADMVRHQQTLHHEVSASSPEMKEKEIAATEVVIKNALAKIDAEYGDSPNPSWGVFELLHAYQDARHEHAKVAMPAGEPPGMMIEESYVAYQRTKQFDKPRDPTPHDVPAFYSGGLVRDSVLMHKADETYGRVDLQDDGKVIAILQARGAIEEANRNPIDPGYNGTAKLYDGTQLTLVDQSADYLETRVDDKFIARLAEEVVKRHPNVGNGAASTWILDTLTEDGGPGVEDKPYVKHVEEKLYKALSDYFDDASTRNQVMNATIDAMGERRIEYVMHDQASWNSGGAPTNQRGALRLVGYTPQEAAERLQELGIIGDLEPEVPFRAVLRSSRRYGPVAPLHEAYIRGEAPLPKTPARITHGITNTKAGGAVESLELILGSGGLMSIHERHRQGILGATKGVSISGDIRSGIDHAVFCTLDSGGACGGGSQVKFIMKPHAFLRRDVTLAPYDYGGCETRYPQYKSYLNGLQGEVGEKKTNLYEPISPAVRQKHFDKVQISGSSEYNIGPTIPIEDMEAIQVPTPADADKIVELLDGMIADGRIASRPAIVVGAAEGNAIGNQKTQGGEILAPTGAPTTNYGAVPAAMYMPGDMVVVKGESGVWKVDVAGESIVSLSKTNASGSVDYIYVPPNEIAPSGLQQSASTPPITGGYAPGEKVLYNGVTYEIADNQDGADIGDLKVKAGPGSFTFVKSAFATKIPDSGPQFTASGWGVGAKAKLDDGTIVTIQPDAGEGLATHVNVKTTAFDTPMYVPVTALSKLDD